MNTTPRASLEVCVDCVAGLDAAVQAGADRIELCSALSLHGLTASGGLMAAAADSGIATFALIRPRAGDFRYGRRDIDVMRRDIDRVHTLRLAGVVIGASLPDGSLDEVALRLLLEHAAGLPATLHRAFDLVPEFPAALETAIRLGFRRVLTSGGAPAAPAGREQIRRLVEQAGTRIEVMAGAGLTPENVTEFVRATGVTAVHASCSSVTHDDSSLARAATLGFVVAGERRTDPRKISAMLLSLQAASRGSQ